MTCASGVDAPVATMALPGLVVVPAKVFSAFNAIQRDVFVGCRGSRSRSPALVFCQPGPPVTIKRPPLATQADKSGALRFGQRASVHIGDDERVQRVEGHGSIGQVRAVSRAVIALAVRRIESRSRRL